MEFFICEICKNEFKTINSLRIHSIKHNISSEDVYVKYVLNGNRIKCGCGCGGDSPFISIGKGFSKYIQSHHNRIPGKNNFQKNPETHKKAIETQKKNWKDGKYKGWWENNDEETRQKIEGIKEKLRNDKNRGKKISKKLTGTPKSEECKKNISITQKERYRKNPNLSKNLSESRIKWIKRKVKKKTKLELKFENILNLLEIENDFQHEFKGKFFDFYIPNKNVLIEVDGDFYHCNPNSIYSEPKYDTQKLTINNDKMKNGLCKKNKVKLLRFWEKEINETPELVISKLKEILL